MHAFARSGDISGADRLARYSGGALDVSERDELGLTALHVAAGAGHVLMVQKLGELGYSVDSKEFANELRPIHMAAVPGHVHVMRTLVTKLEASVDACDNNGGTALHAAALHGQTESIRVLVEELGANIAATQHHGVTALHSAAGKGHTQAVRMLVGLGLDVNVVEGSGRTALHVAAEYGQAEVVRALVELGADLARADKHGETAMACAARWDQAEALWVLRQLDPAVTSARQRAADDMAAQLIAEEAKEIALSARRKSRAKSRRIKHKAAAAHARGAVEVAPTPRTPPSDTCDVSAGLEQACLEPVDSSGAHVPPACVASVVAGPEGGVADPAHGDASGTCESVLRKQQRERQRKARQKQRKVVAATQAVRDALELVKSRGSSLETVVALEQAVKDARIWAARSDELCLLAAEAGALLERAVPEARATAKASSLERLEADMTRLATENLQLGESQTDTQTLKIQHTSTPSGSASDLQLCVVCICAPKNTVVWPCKHLSMCMECTVTLASNQEPLCPICRSPIEEFTPVFL